MLLIVGHSLLTLNIHIFSAGVGLWFPGNGPAELILGAPRRPVSELKLDCGNGLWEGWKQSPTLESISFNASLNS